MFCVSMVLAAPVAHSQDNWSVGLTGGLLRSTLAVDEKDAERTTFSSVTSPSGGIFIERRIGERLSLESGVSFNTRGTRWTIPDGPALPELEFRTLSLDIPVLLHGLAARRGQMQFEVSGGILMSRPGGEQINDVVTGERVGEVPLKFASTQAVVGGRIRADRFRSISFSLRYHYGLTSIDKDEEIKHRSIQGSVSLPLKRW